MRARFISGNYASSGQAGLEPECVPTYTFSPGPNRRKRSSADVILNRTQRTYLASPWPWYTCAFLLMSCPHKYPHACPSTCPSTCLFASARMSKHMSNVYSHLLARTCPRTCPRHIHTHIPHAWLARVACTHGDNSACRDALGTHQDASSRMAFSRSTAPHVDDGRVGAAIDLAFSHHNVLNGFGPM